MTVVAVTGISGHLGRAFAALLDEREDVRRVVGVDLVEPPPGRTLEFYRLDVRSSALDDVIAGCDVLVHLATTTAPMRDEPKMRDGNVGGTRNVLRAAAAAGVSKVIVTSSAMVYGAHPDNDFPLTESSPIRPVRDFPYSAHMGECEEIVADFREANPRITTTVFRPAVLLGPEVRGSAARAISSGLVPGVGGYDPPVQAVHADDAARALVWAVDHELDGAYNLCPGDWIDPDAYAGIVAERRVVHGRLAWPPAVARRRLDRLWALGLTAVPGSFVPFLMYPWVMSSEKLTGTGFSFEHTTTDAVRAAVQARAGRVSVGPFSVRTKRVAAVGAGVALVTGSLARRAARHRRSTRGS